MSRNINTGKWMDEVLTELINTFKNPTWFDRSIRGNYDKVSLLAKESGEIEYTTPVGISQWIFEAITNIIENNELNADETEQVIDKVIPALENSINSHLENMMNILEGDKYMYPEVSDYMFASYHLSIRSTPEALNRFKELLTRKLEKYVVQIKLKEQEMSASTSDRNKRSKEKEPDKHPFTTPQAFEIFKYLSKKYPKKAYSRWSYIFDFMKENNIETFLSARAFLTWIQENYEPGMKSINKQGAPLNEEHEKLVLIYDLYQKGLE